MICKSIIVWFMVLDGEISDRKCILLFEMNSSGVQLGFVKKITRVFPTKERNIHANYLSKNPKRGSQETTSGWLIVN